MMLATTPEIAGYTTSETLGLVRGSTVRTKHVGTDIVASLKALVGGEVRGYSSLMAGAREQAVDRMVAQAQEMGADAVVGLRMETSSIAKGASELLAYGTAVKLTASN